MHLLDLSSFADNFFLYIWCSIMYLSYCFIPYPVSCDFLSNYYCKQLLLLQDSQLKYAARRLARFTEEVQLVRMPPLIASPPRQKVPAIGQPMPKRSRRIAAQPLAHIPISKRARGAPYAEDGLCTAGRSDLIRVQESLRRLFRKELDIERSGSIGRAVPGDQCYDW